MSHSVPRTATFAWSKGSTGSPLLATGTVSGALDESFSSSAALELWDAFRTGEGADQSEPVKGRVSVNARFNRLAWSAPNDGKPEGVIAAGMENGEVGLWDPAKILAGQADDASIFKTDRHKGTVRGLAWNTLQPSLFASGATDAEIFIWNTGNLSKPYGPSANKSRHLSDITALSWNPSVAHILATASASGSTVVWDLKGRQEVIHLSYLGGQGSVYSQGPKPVSSVCWHAERGTRVVTASEDDSAPVILVWDLRNYRTPERVLAGHEKGVLSLDWCRDDPELLFSCGKDCRTLAWNPFTGEMVGELPATSNWSFEVASCPRNPSYVATASFDGKISISSLQNTQVAPEPAVKQQTSSDNAADIFSAGNLSNLAAQVHPGVSLKQPPRWLRRPASNSFGFGGKLATVSTSKAQAQAPQGATVPTSPSQLVQLHQIVTEMDIVERALKLETASNDNGLSAFCEQKTRRDGSRTGREGLESWKLLSSLFQANSKEELVTLLGFSKDDVKNNVEEAIKSFKASSGRSGELALGLANRKVGSSDWGDYNDDAGSIAREPLVTFADQSTNATDAMSGSSEGEGAAASHDRDQRTPGEGSVVGAGIDAAPSETEASLSAPSDATTKMGGAESETTEPSLFGDDGGAPNAQHQATADFYSSLGNGTPVTRPPTMSDRFTLSQHHVDRAGSSVAATIGSRPSSGASDNLKATTFRIYPQDESDADKLLTRALVLGDFENAVSLCLSADRFADALLLAVRGGADLLAKTQKAYFEQRTTSLPYLRLFQSIVSDDLTDVVQNADLQDWQEIFVVLCTFARTDEYSTLIEQLGQRLEDQLRTAKPSGTVSATAFEQRRSAVLCYLAAGKLEKVVSIWIEEMKEEEKAAEETLGGATSAAIKYTANARALQSFIEKVEVFRSAVSYSDLSLAQPSDSTAVAEPGPRTYNLTLLYDKYLEYAELLADQGLVTLAIKYAAFIPADYRSASDGISARDRLQITSAKTYNASVPSLQPQQGLTQRMPYPTVPQVQGAAAPYASSAPSVGSNNTQAQQPAYDDPYLPVQGPGQQQQPSYSQQHNPYAPPNNYGPSVTRYPPQNGYNPANFAPQPPALITTPPSFPNHISSSQPENVPPPPAKKGPVGGWNDAPLLAPKRTNSAASSRVAPIFSPFPNSDPAPASMYGSSSGFPGTSQSQPGLPGVVPPPPPSRNMAKTPAQQQQQQQPASFAPPPPRTINQHQQQPSMPSQLRQQPQAPYMPQQQTPHMQMTRPTPTQDGPPGGGQSFTQQQGQSHQPHTQGQLPPHMQNLRGPSAQAIPGPPQRFGPPQGQQMHSTQNPGSFGPGQGQQQSFIPPPPQRRG